MTLSSTKPETALALAGLLLALSLGCGRAGPIQCDVAGRVTYQEKPVPRGTITFVSDHGPLAAGVLDDDGAYRLQAAAGPHRVAIVAYAADDAPAGEMPATMRPRTSLIPTKYANATTSGLTVVIAAGEKNTCDFQLE